MVSDQATLARSDRVYWGQMVSAQARYLRAVDAGADAEELEELQTVVRFADATYRRLRAKITVQVRANDQAGRADRAYNEAVGAAELAKEARRLHRRAAAAR